MITLRALPAAARGHPDPLLSFYYERLMDGWSAAQRAAARALSLRSGSGRSRLAIAADEWRLIRGRLEPARYVSMGARRGIHRLLNPAAVPLKTSILKDKARFAAKLAKAGLPAPLTVATDLRTPVRALLGGCGEIMLKPSFSSKGKGVIRVRRHGRDWLASDGERMSDTELAGRIGRVVARGGVAQEALTTHPALAGISPDALPTARIMTFRIGDAEPLVAVDVLRLGGGGAPVDNFNHGGLIATASPQGDLTDAWAKGANGLERLAAHPQTSERFARHLPPELTDGARRLAVEAHARIGHGFTLIGWDIGLSDRGPALIEGNWNPGTLLPQCAAGAGLSQTPAGALYLKALDAVPAHRWREAGPLQIDW